MAELTTIRVEKPIVEWLNSIKGYMEYSSGEKLTLNRALLLILAEADGLIAWRQGLIDNKSEDLSELLRRRVDQFWGKDNKNKPDLALFESKDVLLGRYMEKRKVKKK